ncbi:hypothetical protein C8J57DRAFT_1252736 [Mycena rebaudengoi]|nr:hypothetical protein C8J57DRAFT_1252736 [Mycena rebaudengoi]
MPPESAKASDPDPRYTQKFYTGNDRGIKETLLDFQTTFIIQIYHAQVGHKKRVGVTLGSANQCLIRSARWPSENERGYKIPDQEYGARITERGFSDADAVEKELDVRTCATRGYQYFMYYGPMGPASHGSAAPLIEAYSSAFLKMIKKMQRENITSVTIKDKAADDFQEHQEMYVKRTAWIGPCSSWFRRTHDVC